MGATPGYRVFHIPELLELILLQIPPKNKRTLISVSLAWYKILQPTRTLSPASWRYPPELDPYPISSSNIPRYAINSHDIRVNPAVEHIPLTDDDHVCRTDTCGLCLRISPMLSPQILEQRAEEFITEPPITVLAMNIVFEPVTAMLWAKGGIRIRDFLKVYDAMALHGDPAGWFTVQEPTRAR